MATSIGAVAIIFGVTMRDAPAVAKRQSALTRPLPGG
jgi:hypothetical protein